MQRRAGWILPLLSVSVTVLAAACGDDGGPSGPTGTAPVIADLSYSPAAITVGQQNTITGSFTFSDPDGDLKEIVVSVTTPDGQTQELPPQALQGEAGQTDGAGTIMLLLVPPAAGTYTLEVWLTDDGGNESNHLTGTLDAQ
jgi:hypothetical protein